MALLAVHVLHHFKRSSDLTRPAGSPGRMEDSKMADGNLKKKVQSGPRSPRLRSKLNLLKLFVSIKYDIAERMLSVF